MKKYLSTTAFITALCESRRQCSLLRNRLCARVAFFRSHRSSQEQHTVAQDFSLLLAAWGIADDADIPGVIRVLRLRVPLFIAPVVLCAMAAIWVCAFRFLSLPSSSALWRRYGSEPCCPSSPSVSSLCHVFLESSRRSGAFPSCVTAVFCRSVAGCCKESASFPIARKAGGVCLFIHKGGPSCSATLCCAYAVFFSPPAREGSSLPLLRPPISYQPPWDTRQNRLMENSP